MERRRTARLWHLATLLVAGFGLTAQLVLVVSGASVLVTEDPPDLADRLLRLVSYFTIQSNVAVALTALTLVRDPDRDGPRWRVLRLDAIVGITVTGVVHWFLLRPLLHLTGWSYATDKLLHVVVPAMAVLGWLAFGPRPRVSLRVVLLSLVWPAAWLAYTLAMGVVTGWYPYPFLDVGLQGGGTVAIASVGVALGMFACAALVWLVDRLLGRRQSGVSSG